MKITRTYFAHRADMYRRTSKRWAEMASLPITWIAEFSAGLTEPTRHGAMLCSLEFDALATLAQNYADRAAAANCPAPAPPGRGGNYPGAFRG